MVYRVDCGRLKPVLGYFREMKCLISSFSSEICAIMLKHIRICQSSARRNLTPRLQPLAWQVPHVKKSFYQGQEPVCLLHCSSGLESQSFGQSNSRCSLLGSTRQLMCLAIPRKLAATAAEQQPTADASPLKSRDLLRGRAAFFEFKVNGVSFHSRQQFVHGLEAGTLVCIRQ